MGYIYKITNLLNNKVYIGKTSLTVEERWKQHIHDANKNSINEIRPLYRAIKKYGIDNFSISTIGEYKEEYLNEMEMYWIGYYYGYTEGYNATKGGDGKRLYDYDKIKLRLLEHPYISDIAEEFQCSRDLVSDIAKRNNIKTKSSAEINKERKSLSILCIDKLTDEVLHTFVSANDAYQFCKLQGLCNSSKSDGAISHITDCAKGKRKSAYGYKWAFYNGDIF